MAKSYIKDMKHGYEMFVIRKPEGCWDWSGPCSKNPGYGDFCFKQTKMRAHRASWILHFGEIPKGMFVCHKCDNKKCSNPEHLFLATCKENNLDAIKKNLHPTMGKKGTENHCSKLDEEKVRQIREMLKQKISQQKIADKFGLNQVTISEINLKKIWGWLP